MGHLSRPRRRKHQRGIAAVEFALAFPLLVIMTLGLVECGNMFSDWLTVHKAAQVGARFAVTGQGYEDGIRLQLIEQEVGTIMARLGGSSEVTISSWHDPLIATGDGAEGNAGCPCELVQVTVEHDYQSVTGIFDTLFEGPVKLSSSDRKVNEPWYRCEDD